MANTFTCLHFHVVFSTKHRQPWLTPDVEQRVWGYMAKVARDHAAVPVAIGGVDDHVHIVLATPTTMPISRIVQLIKGGSSRWISQTLPAFADFSWQDGYGAFSVSKSNLDQVVRYVAEQRERHKQVDFQREYIALLDRHGIAYDRRDLWS